MSLRSVRALPIWAGVLVVAAWGFMLSHAIAHGAHAHHMSMGSGAEFTGWIGMVVAMMTPAVAGGFGDVAKRSYRSLRQRAMLAFFSGNLTLWALAGVPVVATRAFPSSHDLNVAAVVFCGAACWALVPTRARYAGGCHRRIVLAAEGWPALRTAYVQGIVVAIPCIVTCGPMMLGCAVTGHRLVPMVVGTVATWCETMQFRHDPRPMFVSSALLALWCLAP